MSDLACLSPQCFSCFLLPPAAFYLCSLRHSHLFKACCFGRGQKSQSVIRTAEAPIKMCGWMSRANWSHHYWWTSKCFISGKDTFYDSNLLLPQFQGDAQVFYIPWFPDPAGCTYVETTCASPLSWGKFEPWNTSFGEIKHLIFTNNYDFDPSLDTSQSIHTC